MKLTSLKTLSLSSRSTPLLTKCTGASKATPVLKINTQEQDLGKLVEYEGDVCVLGDVEQGTTVQATGDITVWGNVHGHIHAGWPSRRSAKVYALDVGSSGTVCVAGRRQSTWSVAQNRRNGTSEAVQDLHPPSAIKTALTTGVFATVVGLAISAFPRTVYGCLFDTTLVATGLIRLGGAFLTLIGIQYFLTALGDSTHPRLSFYHSTIISRVFLVLFVGILVLYKALEVNWLWFAGANAIGASIMFKTLYFN